MSCPACGSPDAKFLGTLGTTEHLRCSDCGIDYSVDMDDDEEVDGDFERDDSEDGIDCDDSDDGYALASAGFGTDEDYGCFGGEDF